MFLDAGNEAFSETSLQLIGTSASNDGAAFEPWNDWQPTEILHHGAECCELARHWLRAMDQSELKGRSPYAGPRWLRQRYEWGPTVHPAFWCEAVRAKSFDCGIHAAMAFEAYRSRGVKCDRVQIVQEFSTAATRQWCGIWEKDLARTDWLNGRLIYHECVARQIGEHVAVWDPSSACWVEPASAAGYGSIRAYKFNSDGEKAKRCWNGTPVAVDRWIKLT